MEKWSIAGPARYLRYPCGMGLVKCQSLSGTYNPIKTKSADHSFFAGSEPTGYGRDKDTDRVDGEIESGFRRARPCHITVAL